MTQDRMSSILNLLGPDETLPFADAVHSTNTSLAVGCWTKAKENLAINEIHPAFI
jgi:hypothetical protein